MKKFRKNCVKNCQKNYRNGNYRNNGRNSRKNVRESADGHPGNNSFNRNNHGRGSMKNSRDKYKKNKSSRSDRINSIHENKKSSLNSSFLIQNEKIITREQFIALRKAIKILAENDKDRASKRNRKGFSRKHTKIGHHLAKKEVWDSRDAQIAFQLARYYKRQLPSDLKKIIFTRKQQNGKNCKSSKVVQNKEKEEN